MPKEPKDLYQQMIVQLRKLRKELPDIIHMHPEEKRFGELVKKIRSLAAMVEIIAAELQGE